MIRAAGYVEALRVESRSTPTRSSVFVFVCLCSLETSRSFVRFFNYHSREQRPLLIPVFRL